MILTEIALKRIILLSAFAIAILVPMHFDLVFNFARIHGGGLAICPPNLNQRKFVSAAVPHAQGFIAVL